MHVLVPSTAPLPVHETLATACCAARGPGSGSPAGTRRCLLPPVTPAQASAPCRERAEHRGALCSGLGPERLVSLQEGQGLARWGQSPPSSALRSAGPGWACCWEVAVGACDWTGPELASWPKNPLSPLGKHVPLAGSRGTGAVLPCAPPLPLESLSAQHFAPGPVTCLKAGCCCSQARQTPCPSESSLTL